MIRLLPLLLLLLAGPLTACPARAQDRPPPLPTRDALVGYHVVPANGEAIDVRVALRAGKPVVRMDLPDYTYVLADRASHTAQLIVPLERTYVELPWEMGPQNLFLPEEDARFTRRGEATIAGHRCAVWEVMPLAAKPAGKGAQRPSGTACITAEGIVLRYASPAENNKLNVAEAFVVEFTASPARDFERPAGFELVAPVPHDQ